MIRRIVLKALSDGTEEIDAIHLKTQIEMNILLAILLELELAGTVETLGREICMLSTEMDPSGY